MQELVDGRVGEGALSGNPLPNLSFRQLLVCKH